MDELHVLHEELPGHAEFVADGAAAGVGSSHKGLVLQQPVSLLQIPLDNMGLWHH